jgi:hypothetical protein
MSPSSPREIDPHQITVTFPHGAVDFTEGRGSRTSHGPDPGEQCHFPLKCTTVISCPRTSGERYAIERTAQNTTH